VKAQGLRARAPHHPVERRAVDAERARRLGALAARAVERGADARRGGAVEHVLQRAVGGGRRAGALLEQQVLGRDRVAPHEHDRALDRVLQLAHVAGPAVRGQHLLGLGREGEPPARLGGMVGEEVTGERHDVFASRP